MYTSIPYYTLLYYIFYIYRACIEDCHSHSLYREGEGWGMTSKGRSQFNTSIDTDKLNRFKVMKAERDGIFHKGDYSDEMEKLVDYWIAVEGRIGRCLKCCTHTRIRGKTKTC